jgi:hypothetical protein
MAARVYLGPSTRTRTVPIVYACACGERFRAEIHAAVDTGDAESSRALVEGRLNRVRCPSCEAVAEVAAPVVYHDLEAPRLVLVLPDALRHRELEERARFFDRLAEDRQPAPLYVLEADVVFGAAGLRAVLAPQARADEAFPTPAPAFLPVTTPVTPPPQVAASVAPITEPQRLAATEEDSGSHTRMRMTVPDPRAAMIERWIAGREGPTALLVEDAVLVCAALAPPALEHFLPGKLELRVQLHRLPTYPVLALTLVAPGQRSDDARVLTVPLDVARAAHRIVLDALGRRTHLAVELYDADYLPVVTHEVSGPLEENVRRLVGEARDALERIAPQSRSFERARQQLFQASYDRLGRTVVDLPGPDDPMETPGTVLAALGAVSRWSEPGAEAYLLEIRSLPFLDWKSARARVVKRALDLGLSVPRALLERVARETPLALPSWQELLAIQLKRFSDVSARTRPNDLSATEEANNWESLLRECAAAGVNVDEATRKLALGADRRARAGGGGGVDLRSMSTAELCELLERKELRRDAAIILCERHESNTLAPLFAALPRMTRGEANLVLPAVTRFGPAAEKFLIEGLKSKKSYARQGCALALGTMKTPAGVDALVKLLFFEPTEIWTEVARALGDSGAIAVMPLAARLRENQPVAAAEDTPESRERVVLALAHVAARGLRAPVEMLASGRDTVVAQAAQKALTQAVEVKAKDDAVRKGAGAGAATEQTVVRGFSRRFYEALRSPDSTGEKVLELSAEELEEIDEDEDDLPALRTLIDGKKRQGQGPKNDKERKGGSPDDTTNPTPRSVLPEGGR